MHIFDCYAWKGIINFFLSLLTLNTFSRFHPYEGLMHTVCCRIPSRVMAKLGVNVFFSVSLRFYYPHYNFP